MTTRAKLIRSGPVARKPLVQMELFQSHRHCIVCGDVAGVSTLARERRLCGVCLARATTPCPVCEAVGDAPCTTQAGHILDNRHADRWPPLHERSIASEVGDPPLARKNPCNEPPSEFAGGRDLVAGDCLSSEETNTRSIAKREDISSYIAEERELSRQFKRAGESR